MNVFQMSSTLDPDPKEPADGRRPTTLSSWPDSHLKDRGAVTRTWAFPTDRFV